MPAEVKEQVKKNTKKSAPKNPVQEGGVSMMTPEKKVKVVKVLKAAGLVAAGFVGGVLAGLFINKSKETSEEVVPFDLNE